MRRRVPVFVLVGLLALPASSIAAELSRLSNMPVLSKKESIAAADDTAAINKLIAAINAAAKTNRARMLSMIIINTNVAGPTLERQASRNDLSLGEVYVAHSLVLASNKSFNQIVALKAKGQSWAAIAQAHQVSLKGSTAALKELMRSKQDD